VVGFGVEVDGDIVLEGAGVDGILTVLGVTTNGMFNPNIFDRTVEFIIVVVGF
jgi:hypothetical protein